MFVLDAGDSFLWPVKGTRPGEKSVEKFAFRARFKRLPIDEIKALHKRLMEGTSDDQDLMREVLVGWEDVGNTDGTEPLAFSANGREAMISDHWILRALISAWNEAQNLGKEKN
jgi:hypothetical protein